MTDVSAQHPSASETRRTRDSDTLELREEELAARKERTDAGSVQVEKDVVSERRSVNVPVTREEVVVERRPVDRRPADRPVGQDEEIEIDVSREEVTAEKRPVVYEEVQLGKRTTQETERVEADVRREVAEVRQTGDVPISGDVQTRQGGSRQVWDDAMPSYRQRWQTRYGTTGGRWEDAEPGYRYGYELANDPRYRDRDWRDVETELGSGYSEWSRQSGYRSDSSTWERARENAREAWEDARVKARGR